MTTAPIPRRPPRTYGWVSALILARLYSQRVRGMTVRQIVDLGGGAVSRNTIFVTIARLENAGLVRKTEARRASGSRGPDSAVYVIEDEALPALMALFRTHYTRFRDEGLISLIPKAIVKERSRASIDIPEFKEQCLTTPSSPT